MSVSKWLPQPRLSFVLLLIWLLLSNSIALGHILLGAVFGLVIPLFTQSFWPDQPHLRKPGLLLKFIAMVLVDIVVANWVVARLVLLHPSRSLRPRFVQLPLDLSSDFAITFLAATISLTPGTVASNLDQGRKNLLIHCLDVDDEVALIDQIKTRYEAVLKQVFEAC